MPKHCRCRKGTVPRTFTRQGNTLYELLNVDKETCTQEDIEKAYKKLATEMHPDRNSDDVNAQEKFQELCEAYDILTDKKKKQVYDKFGSLGIHVAGLVGYNKVRYYLTRRRMGYKCTCISLYLVTGCCFCCCCYFCFCFCCGLCIPSEDKLTQKAIEDGKVNTRSPYKHEESKRPLKWNEDVITQQPRNDKDQKERKDPRENKKIQFVRIRSDDSFSSGTKTTKSSGERKQRSSSEGSMDAKGVKGKTDAAVNKKSQEKKPRSASESSKGNKSSSKKSSTKTQRNPPENSKSHGSSSSKFESASGVSEKDK